MFSGRSVFLALARATISDPERVVYRAWAGPALPIDIVQALSERGAFKDDGEREKFRQLCRLLGCIYHYTYFEQLETLRNDYYYFNPELEHQEHSDEAVRERAYAELLTSFRKVLQG